MHFVEAFDGMEHHALLLLADKFHMLERNRSARRGVVWSENETVVLLGQEVWHACSITDA